MAEADQTLLKLLKRAQQRNRFSGFIQLATVNEKGEPNVRTLANRGFAPGTFDLLVVTKAGTEKLADIRFQPIVEVLWYFDQTQEQFRLKCRASIETDSDFRQWFWETRVDAYAGSWICNDREPNTPLNGLKVAKHVNKSSEVPDAMRCIRLEILQARYVDLHTHTNDLFMKDDQGVWQQSKLNY